MNIEIKIGKEVFLSKLQDLPTISIALKNLRAVEWNKEANCYESREVSLEIKSVDNDFVCGKEESK